MAEEDEKTTPEPPLPPPGKRLVLMDESLFIELATEVEWGLPDENHWYTPTVRLSPRRKAVEDPDQATWSCVVTGPYSAAMTLTADVPMRGAVRAAYQQATGMTPTDVWSGWNGAAREKAR